jgi:uncharacterized protein (DUF305 family)
VLEKSAEMICSALSRLWAVLVDPEEMGSHRFNEGQVSTVKPGRLHSVNCTAASLISLAVVVMSGVGVDGIATFAQQGASESPVIVQPGAPGKPTKPLPSDTKASLPPGSKADVEFMQGMIMHHAQAVEMTALIASHTDNKELRALGARISSSQSDEIKFMKRWLATRGESLTMDMAGMPGMNGPNGAMPLMPGMLSAQQMQELRNAKGAEFDRLFLMGMIQHHNGALTMVKDLFDTAGAGQDAEIFNFATDADNTQRAEIKIMQSMLDKKTPEENR